MIPDISERAFEDAIECGLLQHGPDACAGEAPALLRETLAPYGDYPAGRYLRRRMEDYDRELCLLPRDAVDFVLATQPKVWQRLAQHHGAAVREQFLHRLASEIERRGALEVLRNGIKDSGCKLQAGLLPTRERAQRGDAAALRGEPLLRGSPAPLQREEREEPRPRPVPERHSHLHRRAQEPTHGPERRGRHRQYRNDRDPREPLLAFGRCLAHFAVDPDLVYVTTHLRRAEDALPALQPGQVRRRRQPARVARPGAATPPPTSGRRSGPATAS